jgi:hypothetical protein
MVLSTRRMSGSGGLTVANQIYNRFKEADKSLNDGDIAVLDAADYHHYQACLYFTRFIPSVAQNFLSLSLIARMVRT